MQPKKIFGFNIQRYSDGRIGVCSPSAHYADDDYQRDRLDGSGEKAYLIPKVFEKDILQQEGNGFIHFEVAVREVGGNTYPTGPVVHGKHTD